MKLFILITALFDPRILFCFNSFSLLIFCLMSHHHTFQRFRRHGAFSFWGHTEVSQSPTCGSLKSSYCCLGHTFLFLCGHHTLVVGHRTSWAVRCGTRDCCWFPRAFSWCAGLAASHLLARVCHCALADMGVTGFSHSLSFYSSFWPGQAGFPQQLKSCQSPDCG